VVAAVAGLVAIFVAMWRESETFRNALKKLWDTISKKVLKVFEDLKKKVDEALEPLGGLEGVIETLKVVFKGLGDFIGTYVIPVIEFIVGLLIDTLGNAIGFIIDYTGVLIKAWKFAWDAVWAAVEFVVTWFRDTAWPIISGIIDKIKEGFNIAKKAISKAWDDIQDAIKPVVTWFRDTAWPIIDTVIDNVVGAFRTAKRTLDTIWTNIQDRVQTAWDFITGLLKKIWNPFENKLNSVWGTVQTTIGKIKTKIETWIGNISGIVSGVWDGMYSGITSIWGKIKSWWNANIAGKGFTIPGIPGIWDGIDATIPQLAEGGVVQPRSGGTLALIGEAGRPERVEPIDSDGLSQRDRAIIAQLSGAGGSGMTINVFPSEGMDERELAAMIGRELAFQMSKGA
jgi:phage-related protein